MTSLPIVHPYTDAQLAQLYPPDLKLILVQSIFRHGERAPVRVRLENAGIPAHFDLCSHVQRFNATVRLPDSWGRLKYQRLVEEMNSTDRAQLASSEGKTCLLGELTDKGRTTTFQLGQRLRDLYSRIGFLDQAITNQQLYLRSSPMPRALESLQQVLCGMFPAETSPDSSFVPLIRQRNFTQENLFPNEGVCSRLKLLCAEYADKAAKEWNPILTGKASEILGKYVDAPVRIDGNPRLSGLMDTINATRGNNLPLPAALQDKELLETMEKAVVAEWFGGYLANHTYRRLGAGRLWGDLSDQLTNVIKGNDETRVALYGAHDTTLGALLTSIGAFDGKWPPFTSHIEVETFQKDNGRSFFSKKEHFIRVRFNDKIMDVVGCQDPKLCTLAEFNKIMSNLVPEDWEAECNAVEP